MKAYLELIDRIVRLIKSGDERNKNIFNDIVNPLFHDLQPIVDDMLKMFHQATKLLQFSTELSKCIEILQSHRSGMLLARTNIREMTKVLQDKFSLAVLNEFLNSVELIFKCTNRAEIVTHQGSNMQVLYDLFTYIDSGDLEQPLLCSDGTTLVNEPINPSTTIKPISRDELNQFISNSIETIEKQ